MKNCLLSLLCGMLCAASLSAQTWSCGNQGSNVTATLSNGTLIISGTGAMENYTYNTTPPWRSSSFTAVSIAYGVTSIGSLAFYGNSRITSVIIPNSVTTIGHTAFYSAGLTSVTIPNSVTTIESHAFQNCYGLKSVTIPNSVTIIAQNTFYNCSGLMSVTIGNSVTVIQNNAFSGCSGLAEIINLAAIPPTINTYVFEGVNKLTCTLWVPEGTASAYQAAGWTGFGNIAYGQYGQNGQNELNIADTRSVRDLPNFATGKFRLDFKLRSIINGPGSGAYSTSMTISPWINNAGGLVHQLNFNDEGVYHRTGVFENSSWNSWSKFVVENASGNVGIGITSPTTKLHVVGNTYFNGNVGIGIANPTTKLHVVGNTYFNGNVGIGIINPAVKLDINGIIRAHEVRVCLNQGCDYVFEDNYQLMNLSDLSNFIKTNKHLPDVASAAEMEAEGINLSEMNALLLRKLEELTLHIIGQNEKLQTLEEEINKLKNKYLKP